VEAGPKNGKMIVKPLIGAAEFKRELKGCMENSKIDPLEAKRIWPDLLMPRKSIYAEKAANITDMRA
jgi:hypothetical protein